jgi:hypothetical protein
MMPTVATAAVGRDDGRASALTVVLPLVPGGRYTLAARFLALRQARMRHHFAKVDELQFISAIRWSLLPALDVGAPDPARARRWHLLFESNFDGDWDEYLDTFGAEIPTQLQSIIGAGVGYPGLEIPGMFKAYARATDNIPEHYAAANPSLTARDIRRELLVREGRDAIERIAAEGYGRSSPRWTTFLLRLVPGRVGAATRAARSFDDPGDHRSLLLVTGRVHFARLVILRSADASWLLLTMTHDGPVEPIIREIIRTEAAVSTGRPSRMRTLLDCVEGVPVPSEGWWDDDHLARFLLGHRPASARHFVAFCPFPGCTVGDLTSFVEHPRRDDRWPTREART